MLRKWCFWPYPSFFCSCEVMVSEARPLFQMSGFQTSIGNSNFLNTLLAYKASLKDEYNPNHLQSEDFNLYIGNSVNECDEFAWRHMEDFKQKYGNPVEESMHSVYKYVNDEETQEIVLDMVSNMLNELSWYKRKGISSS